MPDHYAPMAGRAAHFAKSKNWAYAAIMLAALWFGFQILFGGFYLVWMQLPGATPEAQDAFFDGSTPAAVRWTLASFAIYTAILLAVMRAMHQTGISALIGNPAHALRDFGRVSLYLLPIYAFLTLPSLTLPDAQQQFSVFKWLTLLPMILPLLFVQISAEEFVFRGYLQSHLAALAATPLVWMGLPSVLFGLIHYYPTVPAYSGWSYVIWASVLGLICADVTARSGTLGPALAIHFINNLGAMVILAADNWLYGAALFVWPTFGQPWVPWIPFDALFLFTVWLAARVALRR